MNDQEPSNGLRANGVRWATLSAALALACGPSLANVHEGSIRFEHCNRLDLDERVGREDCRQCWSTWLARHTYGQPHDRIDYARRRTRALGSGDPSRPVLRLAGEQKPEARQFYLVVPSPTSVRAPPPPVATVWQGDAGTLAKSVGDGPPAEVCAETCRNDWQTCNAGCADGGSRSDGAACSACGTEYSSCMRRCFE